MKSVVSQRELKPSTSGSLVPKGVLAISMAKLEILVGKSNGCAIAFEKLQNIRGYYHDEPQAVKFLSRNLIS